MSKTKYYSKIREANRQTWRWYSEDRKQCLLRARVGRGISRCEQCEQVVPTKIMQCDHVKKVTPYGGMKTDDDCLTMLKNLHFPGLNGLMALCKPCHLIKTKEERRASKAVKKTKKRSNKTNQL